MQANNIVADAAAPAVPAGSPSSDAAGLLGVPAVPAVFALTHEQSEVVAMAAELASDSIFDFAKASDAVAHLLVEIRGNGALTFAQWEVVRERFVDIASRRSKENGAADPVEAGKRCWQRMAQRIDEIHGIEKPKATGKAAAVSATREAAKAEAINLAAGRSSDALREDIRAHYGEATDESIAKAKALEKALKITESAESAAKKAQMKPLISAAGEVHKSILEYLKDDGKRMGDYVVLLKGALDLWKQADMKAAADVAKSGK